MTTSSTEEDQKQMSSFETVFNVPLECESCAESVKKAVGPIEGITDVHADVSSNTVRVLGNVPPSQIVNAIRETGKDAIIRGTGKPNSAAVCILESFDEKDKAQPVKGLARIVAIGDADVFVDLTVNGLPKGTYYPQIRKSGNLSLGAFSTGEIFHMFAPIEVDQPSDMTSTIQSLGAFSSDSAKLYSNQSFLRANLRVSELIGRSMILSSLRDEISSDSLCGVIARSAGAWENNKEVCSCTGKSVWQERSDALSRGITS